MNPTERTLIGWLLLNGVPEARAYVQQLDGLHVVGRCSCGCGTVDLAVADARASTTGPSLILADFMGLTPEHLQVGVLLHAREGKISELEIYPLGETTASLPTIESLKLLE